MKNHIKIISLSLLIVFLTGMADFEVFADNENTINIEGNTYFEAENFYTINTPLVVTNDDTAMGGKYVEPIDGSASMTSPQRDYVHLSYKMNVPKDAGYFVWMRVRTTDTLKYYMCFDDGVYKKQQNQEEAAKTKNEWVWVCAQKYWLNAGEHELKIRYCSYAMDYDAFYITSDYNFYPENAKPAVSFDLYERDEKGNIINMKYNPSSYIPPAEHPRLLFTKDDIPKIKSNLTHSQNIAAYNELLENAKYNSDGKMPELQYGQAHNIDNKTAFKIEANALLYQLTGDSTYGYEAIKVARNLMESAMIDESNASSTGRNMMWAIWSVSLCYDWCYDLLTEDDKDFLGHQMMFNTRFSEPGYPPVKYGIHNGITEINGHNLEFQTLCGMMAMGVAMYDEAPDYYNMVAGRIEQYIVPAVNRFNESSMYTEGSNYGMYRHYYEILNNYIYKAMGYENVYSEEGLLALSYMYLRQPDGELVVYGDDYTNYKNGYSYDYNNVAYFLLGNMLKNSYFKTEYWRTNIGNLKTQSYPGHISPAMWLVINDVDVACDKSVQNFPLTTYTGDDSGYMVARTSWDEGYSANTAICLMNLKKHFLGGHDHKDVGHFSLYYKGILALDSGAYQGSSFTNSKGEWVSNVGWGHTQHRAYATQSIAHNTILVYDPNEEIPELNASYFSTIDGGQKHTAQKTLAMTIDEIDDEAYRGADVLGYNWGPDTLKPTYSYMKGDLTDAYTDKVENFRRSFMFFNFEDETYPAALIVFDSVRSASPTFKKTWLLHSEEEPVIDGNSVTITRDTVDYNGILVNQTLLPDNGFNINKIGQDFDGVSKYLVGDTLYEIKPQSTTAEIGNWRIEISPTTAEKQSYFLNVLQVGDNDETITPLKAELLENTNDYVGVEINNHIAYFRKDGKSLSKNITINPGKSVEERFVVVTGLGEGIWTVCDESGKIVAKETVYSGRDSLSFKAKGEKFTLKYGYGGKLTAPDYSVFALAKDDEKPIEVNIDKLYYTFKNQWIEKDGTVYAPVEELLEKLDIESKYCTVGDNVISLDNPMFKYEFKDGAEGVIKKDGIFYVSAEVIEKIFISKIEYNSDAKIVTMSYGNKLRDRIKIYNDPDPSVARIFTAYTEGETTAVPVLSLDNDTATYSCTIGEGSFIAVLAEPAKIDKVALWWTRGNQRKEIFEMYVSKDGESWKLVFAGTSDGVTNGFEYVDINDADEYRYVKLDCHGNTANTYNSLAEIKIYK